MTHILGVLQTALSYSGDSGTPVDLSVASEVTGPWITKCVFSDRSLTTQLNSYQESREPDVAKTDMEQENDFIDDTI